MINMDDKKQIEIKNKVKEFSEAILECEEYESFITESEKFDKNSEAHNLLNKFQQKKNQLQWGFDSQLFDELQKLQMEINKNKTIQDFVKSQENLVNLLKRTNEIISEKIGTQFAFFQGSGCCG